MRYIDEIILHCSATKCDRIITASDINRFHKSRGFKCIGYHFFIRLDGTIEIGRPLSDVGAHCLSHNAHSIGICYAGGLDSDGKPSDTRTDAQKLSLYCLIESLRKDFPHATLHGHNEFANKACPCFDVRSEYISEFPSMFRSQ